MGLIENVKDTAKLVQQIGNIELYEKLVALQIDALSILDENFRLKEENRNLKDQLQTQNRFSEIDGDMEFVEDGGFYIKRSEKAAGKNIPYCPICWKVDKKDVPLNPLSGKGTYRCSLHNTAFETKVSREQHSRRFSGGGTPRTGPWS